MKRSNKKRRRRGRGGRAREAKPYVTGVGKDGKPFAVLPEGYSPEEIQAAMGDPDHPLYRALMDARMAPKRLSPFGLYMTVLKGLKVSTLENESARYADFISVCRDDLSRARIVGMPISVFERLCGEVFQYLESAYFDGHPMEQGSDAQYAMVEAAAARVDMPAELPFELTFFALGAPVPEDSTSYNVRMHTIAAVSEIDAELVASINILGMLVGPGLVVEFLLCTSHEGLRMLLPLIHRGPKSGEWTTPAALSGIPWLTEAMVDLVNDYRSVVITEHNPSFTERRDIKKQARKQGLKGIIPKPWYEVRLNHSVTYKSAQATLDKDRERQAPKESGTGRKATYRHDVRGHERVYVQRGPKPMPEALRRELEAKRYRIYLGPLSFDDARRVNVRGLEPKRQDEWMAVKHTRVRAHVSPANPDLPYVPAVHAIPETV